MGFCPKGLWVMGYGGLMGFGLKKVWVLWGYGLSRSWVMRVPTTLPPRIYGLHDRLMM
ncbi:hypothetical protein CPB84DRAFT_1805077 [Gymnopilus junonius]|uniref:Uncharacterized protein n=1 Tax=Gymnopilus junonius TaxID=109634 RepID=A0A9P5N7B4_GYMJU|nr:hypothetical protein CPB84DRAFT_1805077 [Gymnopilus junonius]